ncbi:MAG: hypothetical protein ACK5LJ_03160 [Paracoccus sp. (in: a-proteobacteria)]
MLEQAADGVQAEELATPRQDPDPAVRSAAVRVQDNRALTAGAQALLVALQDPSRSVRIAAAQAMLSLPTAHLPDRFAKAMRSAYGEWQAALAARLDYPETHLQLAGTALTMRSFPAAAAAVAFAKVTRLDPQQVDARVMRIRIAASLEGRNEAENLLKQAIAANPTAQPL